MKEIIFNTKEYTSKNETYKDFYRDIFIKLDAKSNIDFADEINLRYNADILNEFMWYYHNESNRYVFINLEIREIEKQKTADDYEWGIILKVLKQFVTDFPNNTLEFRNE
ncbi:MAG: hypothetical protein RR123_01925 [Clostridia bacterium]